MIHKTPPPKRYHTIPNGSGAISKPKKARLPFAKPRIVTGVAFPLDTSSSRLGKYRAKEKAAARNPRTTEANAVSHSPAAPNATAAPPPLTGPTHRNGQA